MSTYQLTPFMPVFGFVFAISTTLCVYALVQYVRYDRRPVVLMFAICMAAISSWELINFLVDAVSSEQLKLLGKNVVNAISAPLLAYALLAFSAAYSEREGWIWYLAVACTVQITGITIALFFVPELLYESNGLTTYGPLTVGGFVFSEFALLDRIIKLPFVIYTAYTLSLVAASAVVLIKYAIVNRRKLIRAQVGAAIIGICAPLGVAVIFITGTVSPAWNPTDPALGITAVGLGAAVFRYRLIQLVPVGRQQIVDFISDPVIVVDDDDRVVDCNRSARKLLDVNPGWRRAELRSFFHADYKQIQQSIEGKNTTEEVVIGRGRNERYFTVSTRPIHTLAAETAGMVITLREVTDTVARKQKVQRQNEKLQQFSNVLAHDIRSPLSVANGLVKQSEAEGDIQSHANQIKSAHEHIDTLIDDMITLTRTETASVDKENIDLSKVASQAWEFTDTAGATLYVDGTLPVVAADRSYMLRLFENLFQNAAEHAGDNTSINIGSLDESGFYVEDDGNGIPPAKRDEVLKYGVAFSQDGTGLGLSIVKKAVNLHEWDIEVTTSCEGGARFEVAFSSE